MNKHVKESCIIEKNSNVHAVLLIEKGNPKKIIQAVNEKLEPHQKIVSYSIWKGDFPKTPTGKIKKYEVKEKLKHPHQFEYKRKLYELLSSSLNTKIRNTPLTALGMDSLKRIEILALIEENYGIELNEQNINEKTTPKSLEKLIKKKKKIYSYDFFLPLFSHVGNLLASLLVKIFCRIKCKNKTKFSGLIVSNHVSALDVPVIASCIKSKYAIATLPYVMGIGKKGPMYKLNKLRAFFIKHLFNTFPFGPEIGLENSLKFTAHLLDEGYSIMIFPEGTRTKDGNIHEFKEGIGFLSQNMDAEILPVKTDGLFYILPRGKFIPKLGDILVKTGKPFKTKKMSYLDATNFIEKKVKEL